MMIDPENPVVKLCAQGMQAEGEGQYEQARALFEQAWQAASDDYEACIAAHYLARHQPSPEDTLRWNQESLSRAEAVSSELVESFFPSLYLNIGHSHEQLGHREEARRFFEIAAQRAQALPDDRYGEIVRQGAEAGLKRLEAMEE